MSRNVSQSNVAGLLVVDKSAGWTSHDIVAKTRGIAKTRRVGHAGTLDPMATGVLVLGVNQATKLLTFLVGLGKTYEATIRLGQSTVTDDAEGDVVIEHDAGHVTDAQVAEAVTALTGDIMQRPSSVSAIKVDGKRSYARVRSGEEVKLAPRPVTIRRFEIHSISRVSAALLDVEVTVSCSSGTYIRALARDLGESLGVGGHLTRLRRTQVGPFGVDQAQSIEQIAGVDTAGLPLISMAEAARRVFPVLELSEVEASKVRQGQRLAPGAVEKVAGVEQLAGRKAGSESLIAAILAGPDPELVGVLAVDGDRLRSRVVFPAAAGGAKT